MPESWKAQQRRELMEERRDPHEEAKATCFGEREPPHSWQTAMDLNTQSLDRLEKTESLWDHLRLQKAAYFPANSNGLGYLIRDLATAGWRCARCQGVVVTEAEVHAARDPEALDFLVKQAIRRHRQEAHSADGSTPCYTLPNDP